MKFMFQTMILLRHLEVIWVCFTLYTERFVPFLLEPKPNLGSLKENEEDKEKLSSLRQTTFVSCTQTWPTSHKV